MSFEKLGVHPGILKAVKELGFEKPTPIQEQAIPLLLQGSDLIGQAKTGSGKTAAFAISILETLSPEMKIQAMVLVPTRELAQQVVQEFKELGKYLPHSVLAVYGGEDIERQIRALQKGVRVIVCTPGRLLDHLERRTISLAHVKVVVLDEADRMLDMGFIDDIRNILKHVPEKRQTMFFSATMPEEIIRLAQQNTRSPEIINTSADVITVETISQHYILSDPRHRVQILLHLLRTRKPALTIIFTRTKRGADNLFYSLERNGLKASLLHGNLTQSRREKSMAAFRSMHSNILVATDIAARGIDVDDVGLVVNYNIPEDAMVYAHRIGRTARMGKSGDAITFATNLEEKRALENFALTLKCQIPEMKVEGLHLPQLPEEQHEYRGFGERPRSFSRAEHYGERRERGGFHRRPGGQGRHEHQGRHGSHSGGNYGDRFAGRGGHGGTHSGRGHEGRHGGHSGGRDSGPSHGRFQRR